MLSNIENNNQILVQSGNFIARLHHDDANILKAQQLRYEIFYEELKANNPPSNRLDIDEYDNICDHLCVFDISSGAEVMCGTYRLLRKEQCNNQNFYSASEYDIKKILAYHGNICEMGRSCVKLEYRTKPVMELLWRAIGSYVLHYKIDLMFGCASFAGTDFAAIHDDLAYLQAYHLADSSICPMVIASENSRELPKSDLNLSAKEQLRAFNKLPALIKGYLRLGGKIGQGAYIDYNFNTIDVFIMVATDKVQTKYYEHYTKHVA